MADDRAERTRALALGLAASIVRWVGLAAAVILVIHVVLVAGEANPANWINQSVGNLADVLSLGFKDLFNKPADDLKLRVLINYGTAAVFWLVVSGLLARLIRWAGPGD
jgi:hypothetical protein